MTDRGDFAVMIVCGLSLLAVMTVVRAQALTDPTRPPGVVERSPPAVAGTRAESVATTGLQTIIRSRDGKPAAVINGEYVTLGGRVGDARVIRIGEDSVTLQGPAGRETLKLMPGIEKTPATTIVEKDGRKPARDKPVGTGAGK
ncbi:MAG: hypothetical protein Q7U97_14010 [Rhodocyclaceae bacterium]|nr:hypothetical protein [Rhodocyclaceae bacterium]